MVIEDIILYMLIGICRAGHNHHLFFQNKENLVDGQGRMAAVAAMRPYPSTILHLLAVNLISQYYHKLSIYIITHGGNSRRALLCLILKISSKTMNIYILVPK